MPAVRARTRRPTGNEVVDNLNSMINELIKENRKLRRQVEKLSATATGATAGAIDRGLRGIQRRLQAAIADSTGSARRRPRATAPRPRKPVSPEVAEKRRQALARAREARRAKRAAASASSE